LATLGNYTDNPLSPNTGLHEVGGWEICSHSCLLGTKHVDWPAALIIEPPALRMRIKARRMYMEAPLRRARPSLALGPAGLSPVALTPGSPFNVNLD